VCGVTSEMEKFAYAADALQYESLRLVTDLVNAPPAVRPYQALKERLLLAHQLTPLQKAQKVNAMPALGDRRPSQLLAELLEYCPDGEENSAFFRSAFIHRLPNEIQVLLDGAETDDLKTLAQKADRLWVTRSGRVAAISAVTAAEEDQQLHEDSECVAAIKQHPKKKNSYYNKQRGDKKHTGGGGNSNGGGGYNKKKNNLVQICKAHMRYGADAYNCQDQQNCRWPGN